MVRTKFDSVMAVVGKDSNRLLPHGPWHAMIVIMIRWYLIVPPCLVKEGRYIYILLDGRKGVVVWLLLGICFVSTTTMAADLHVKFTTMYFLST
jgi:hypothetical protein